MRILIYKGRGTAVHKRVVMSYYQSQGLETSTETTITTVGTFVMISPETYIFLKKGEVQSEFLRTE